MGRTRLWLWVAALVVVAACGGGSVSPAADESPTPSSPAGTSTSATSAAPTSATPTPVVDVAGAVRAARRLFVQTPNNVNDPSAGSTWTSVPWTTPGGPLSAAVKARLAALNKAGFFDDRHCGESYIDGTQYGLLVQPRVRSTHANADGTVTVVLHRADGHSSPPDLTVVLTKRGGGWLVTDLASGAGPSIFSATPAC